MTMHNPQNMFELIDFTIRHLGGDNMFQSPVGGVIEIDVTKIQCIDRVMDMLSKFKRVHYAGYNESVIKLQTKYGQTEYDLPPEILSIGYYLELDDTTSLFSIDYQIKQSIGMRLSQFDIVTVELMYEYLKQLNMQIGKKISFSFNPYNHKFILNSPFDRDQLIALVGMIAINPDLSPEVWSDPWVKDYTLALIKQQWGYNIKSKFSNVTLPGGIQLTGKEIYDEASAEKEKLEEELNNTWSKPLKFFMG